LYALAGCDILRFSGRRSGCIEGLRCAAPIAGAGRRCIVRAPASRPAAQSRVAVIDDDRSVRRALCRLLRAADLEAIAYESAAEFLETLKVRVPDCLVLDLQMPGMSGLELQQHLAEISVTLPIVVITGHDDATIRSMCMAAGASTYLSKPIDESELLAAINDAISREKHHRH
jgi:FixJ family two-component response regulator